MIEQSFVRLSEALHNPTIYVHYDGNIPPMRLSSACPESCGGTLQRTRLDIPEQKGRGLVIVKDVPCDQCDTCSSAWYNNSVSLHVAALVKAAGTPRFGTQTRRVHVNDGW